VCGGTVIPPHGLIKKTMRRNTVAINNIVKKKNYKTKFSISFILKKIKKYNLKK
jgi:hypothetical protein